MDFVTIVSLLTRATELAGTFVLIASGVVATGAFLTDWLRRGIDPAYRSFRANLGRSILLGLEILIIADIIRTIAIEPTLENVGVLALIVGIRTFLSFALEVEIGGAVPWRRERSSGTGGG